MKPSDEQILSAFKKWGGRHVTYYIKNVLRMEGFPVDTAWVRRRLMRLESEGLVKRTPTNYARQICWDVVGEHA